MAIQMRRGLEADFNPDKMKPGEWAVSLDKKYVRMCFAPGLCFRMATYESFEEDMQEIQNILASVNSTKEAIDAIKLVIDEKSTIVAEKTDQALQYADVATQKAQEATDASNSASESATNANAYATSARESADMASTKATESSQSASNANASSESASNSAATASLKANDANTSATNARNSADNAQSNATLSESYAKGGTGTREGEDTDNAKYYYEQAKEVSNVDIATTEKAGIVKPDGTSVTVDPDGTIHAQTGTNIETLNDVGDVNIQNPKDKQALVYDSETQTWKNGEGSVSPIDNLNSNSTTEPLSANQGQVLNEKKLNKIVIAKTWDSSKTYFAGDYCIYNNLLWKCLIRNTNFLPSGGGMWEKVNVVDELNSVKSSLGGVSFGIDGEGNYGYFGADGSLVPFSKCNLEILTIFTASSGSNSNASLFTFTFPKNYKKVLAIISMHDTDNNGDNYCKVFSEEQSGTAWNNFKNNPTDWKSIDISSFISREMSLATVKNNYSDDEDKNKTIYYATGTSSSTAFQVLTYKENVMEGEVAYMYINTYRRCLVTLIGID